MPRALRLTVLTLALLAALCATASARTPKRTVPQGFVGMNVSDGALDPRFPIDQQMGDMVKAGVESVVSAVSWPHAQPMEGGPIDFAPTDRMVLAAARRRLTFLPVVVFAPAWAATFPGLLASPPRADAYAAFLAALVHRYGPNGTLWTEHREVPKVPVRSWQVWNEPDILDFWAVPTATPDQARACPPTYAWQKDYVAVLRAAHGAVKAADPGAKVVLGALVGCSWDELASLYKAGARGLFDAVALHPYTSKLSGVLNVIRYNRSVMNKNGDRRLPIVVTEVGWPPSDPMVKNKYGFEVKLKDLPRLIRAALPAYASVRRSLGVSAWYWFTWATADVSRTYPFDYAGLRTITSPGTTKDKPSLAAFRSTALRLEGCRSKGTTATACRR